jgi:DNA-binding FadR family transcriptional regulator
MPPSALAPSRPVRSLEGARAGSHDDFRTWDFAFHRGVALALGNPLVAEALENTFALIVTLRERDLPHIHFHVECAEAHVRIATAIEERNRDAAEREMRAHVHQVRDYVVESFIRAGGVHARNTEG